MNSYIRINFTLYLPYLIVDLPFYVDQVRKSGKNTLTKTRPRSKDAARGKEIPAKLYGSCCFCVSADYEGCCLSAHASASNRNPQQLPVRINSNLYLFCLAYCLILIYFIYFTYFITNIYLVLNYLFCSNIYLYWIINLIWHHPLFSYMRNGTSPQGFPAYFISFYY